MEEHYKTFIVSQHYPLVPNGETSPDAQTDTQTERDFADIAAAGLNWVRIPIGYWAIETQGDEPFLEGVSWK
jgi:aryl-phospho-beta-D-glucosidase BglC (GH1 family)